MFLVVFEGKTQTNLALYSFQEHFNSSGFNPAFLSSPQKFTLSIFPLGGTSIGYDNQEVTKGILKESLLGIKTDEEYISVLRSLTNRTSFNQSIESTLLTFTLGTRSGFFNFRINEKQNLSATLKGELTDFIFNPGVQAVQINQIQNLPGQAMHYREYSIGYSMPETGHRFTAGIRGKVYFGKAAFTSGLSGSITNDSGDYFLKSSGRVNLSIPLVSVSIDGIATNIPELNKKNIVAYMMDSGNLGFGIDLGFKYKIKHNLILSMSAIDLGKIGWKTNLNSRMFIGEFSIPKAQVISNHSGDKYEIITKNFSNSSFADSLTNKFEVNFDNNEFSSRMPVTVYTGIQYQLNPRLKISLVDRFVYLKNMNTNNYALIASFDINKKVSVSSGYASNSNSYMNLPLAFLFKRDFGQLYFGTDDMLSLIIPSISDIAGFTFGACIYLFRNHEVANVTDKQFPFYKPRKAKQHQKTGLIWN